MRKICTLWLLLLSAWAGHAQYKVTFRITRLPDYHKPADFLYLAASFNNWNPAQESAKFKSVSGVYSLELSLPKGKHEFKVTRGTWASVEAADGGASVDNRVVEVLRDTTIVLSISHWADHFSRHRVSTANRNVRIVDTAFYIPQLSRYRRIWVYLPAGYASSKKKYPVLYLHDGQNVFDDTTSFSGEWGVDEALDTLGAQWGEAIVVAVDNGGEKRLNEYAPYDMERFGKGEGDLYVDFLVQTLQPYIHKRFRTKRCGRHQFIAGSSMGGLISFYAILKYPKKFGGAGVFSPAFWVNPQIKDTIPDLAPKVRDKIYFYAGMQESDEMVPDMLTVFELMRRHSKAHMTSVVRAEGKHSEATWRKEFPLFYKWIHTKK